MQNRYDVFSQQEVGDNVVVGRNVALMQQEVAVGQSRMPLLGRWELSCFGIHIGLSFVLFRSSVVMRWTLPSEVPSLIAISETTVVCH